MAVFALGAVADPAAIAEFALVAQSAQNRIVKFARRLAVERADGDVTDHEILPNLARQHIGDYGTNQEQLYGQTPTAG
jgi:hypothetical protein